MIALDDDIGDHPKFVGLSDEAFGLWVRCIGYCRRNRTDGYIPEQAALQRCRSRNPRKVIAELTGKPAGAPEANPLWTKVLGGYQVHDYLDWNPSREQVLAKVEAKRQAGRLGGRRSGEARRQQRPEQGRSDNEALCFESGSTKSNPDPIRSDPIRDLSLEAVAEDLVGDPAREPARPPQQQRHGLSAQWLLGELRRHPGLSAVANEHFAASLVGVLVSKPKPPDVVSQAIADAALHSAGLGLTAETLQRKVSGYVLNARRREAPKPETRCPASTDTDVAEWLKQERLPALSSKHGADVALMLDHHAERAMTSASWSATWSKWRASERPHPVGPAPGHRKREPREELPVGPIPTIEETQARAREAVAKLGGIP